MSLTDFLFQGSSPPNSPATGGSRSIPQWQSDANMQYANQVMGFFNSPADEYTPSPYPQLAGPTGATTQSWNETQNLQGKYEPDVQGALGQTERTMGIANPYFSGAASNINSGAGGSFTGNNVSAYMNPYLSNVVDQSTNAATQNFEKNILPGLNSQFIAAGQTDSLGNEAQADQAAKDLTTQIQMNAGSIYGQGYNSAEAAYEADKQRALSGGSAMGYLGTQAGDMNLSAANQAGAQGMDLQKMGYADVGAENASGAQQGEFNQAGLNLANQNFQNQLNWQPQQLAEEGQMLGMIGPQSTGFSTTQPSTEYGSSPIGTAGALSSAISGIESMGGAARGGFVNLEPHHSATRDEDLPAWLRQVMLEALDSHSRRRARGGLEMA